MDVLTCDQCSTGLPLDAAACSACGSTALTRRLYVDDITLIALTATAKIDSRMSLTAVFFQSPQCPSATPLRFR